MIYALVVFSLTFFGSIPILSIKLLLFSVFIIATVSFLVIFGRLFLLPGIQTILAYRKGLDVRLPDEIAHLANQMNVKVAKLRIVERLCNAYVIGTTVVLGRELLEKLDLDEIIGVTSHEFAHKKGKHIPLRIGIMIPFWAFALFCWSRLYSPIFFTVSSTQILLAAMVNIGILAFLLVAMIIPNWMSEFKADESAARFAGKASIRSALLKLVKKQHYEESSETHPSLVERLKRIDKLKP